VLSAKKDRGVVFQVSKSDIANGRVISSHPSRLAAQRRAVALYQLGTVSKDKDIHDGICIIVHETWSKEKKD